MDGLRKQKLKYRVELLESKSEIPDKLGRIPMPRHLHCASTYCFFVLPRRVGDANPSKAQKPLVLLRIWFFLALLLILPMGLSTIISAQMVMDIDHEMQANKAEPRDDMQAKCPDETGNQSLPAGNYTTDLHIVGPCVADQTKGNGIYKYHWVFIHNGGTLTFEDKKLDLYANSILVLNGGTLTAGGPSDTKAIGVKGGLVTIHLWGGRDDAAIPCEDADGKQDPMCGVDSTIWNTKNKIDKSNIYPTDPCEINPQDPRKDCFYPYDDSGVSTLYFGRKTLAVSYGGTLQLFGKKGSTFDGLYPPSSDTGKSWRRLVTDLKQTADELGVDGEVDWQPGDHIVITATDYLPGHAEEAIVSRAMYDAETRTTTIKISGVVLDNGMVQNGGVRFPHNGTTYKIPLDIQTKLKLDRSEVETRAAVALLSRNIRIVSEGDTGPNTSNGTEPNFPPDPGNFFGGHVIFRQGFKQIQIQGVEFRQLGQGGLLGRYAVHFHMDRKVPVDTFVKDCSMNESMTRWITIHGTEGVLLARNVGWKSIGHGFYIEDGSETDNKFYSNIGVLARAGVANSQNPRTVPGILANKDVGEVRAPFNSDWQHPSVFWIMNGSNDFEYNMAAGAGSCGVCYWLTAGANSGPSRYEYWTGYASRQRGLSDALGQRDYNAGTSPLEKFVGNSCSTAMFSFMEVGNPDFTCQGFGQQSGSGTVAAIPGMGPSVPSGPPPAETFDYYPITIGNRDPTLCSDLNKDCGDNTNLADLKCGGSNSDVEKNCVATVLSHYTTSFNWAEKNFSSIWMRNWWKLITDSSVTDQLGPGLTMVTGGGYTRSDVAMGNWLVGLRDVYVGQTQKDPAGNQQPFFASDVGPFTPNGIPCDNGSNPQGYCLSKDNGVSMTLTPFNSGQRMFNIYDGPSFQESSAYLDIKARPISDCTPEKRHSGDGVCDDSKYMYGHAIGLLQGTPDPKKPMTKECYIPNAAIAWKQENGFYYPPAFYSRNLVFSNVDIRHFVIEPLFNLNTFQLNEDLTRDTYCTWTKAIFEPFNDIDRQTVLNDIDGSLTGVLAKTKPKLRETLSINEDIFFRAPTVAYECASKKHYGSDYKNEPATAITSPYEYVTSAIIADCALMSVQDKCLDPPTCTNWDRLAECGINNDDNQRNWSWVGTHAYGVPLFRQYWTMKDNQDCDADAGCSKENRPLRRPGRITMMGQSSGQRSTLTANQGWYYIDTTVPAAQQVGVPFQNGRSVFLSGHNYYVYVVYGAPSTHMEYWMYVGAGANPDLVVSQVGRYRMNNDNQSYVFNSKKEEDPDFLTNISYDPISGWLKVTVDLSKYGCGSSDQNCEFENDKVNFCKPETYCQYDSKSKTCGCKDGSACKTDKADSACSWGITTPDCPSNGCFAFSFKIQPEFDAGPKPGPPPWSAFPSNPYWNVDFEPASEGTSGPECYDGPKGNN